MGLGFRIFPTLLFSTAVLVLWSFPLAAQTVLIDPDWNEFASTRDATANSSVTADAAPPTNFDVQTAGDSSTNFDDYRLPVLGLVQNFVQRKSVNALNRDQSSDAQTLQTVWPKCARATGTSDIAGGEKGEWYSIVYDFDCISVVVSGDRRAPIPSSKEERDIAEEGRGEQLYISDENDDNSDPSRAEYTFVRFNVPYSVIIECTKAAGNFCGDIPAHNAFLASIDFLGGKP